MATHEPAPTSARSLPTEPRIVGHEKEYFMFGIFKKREPDNNKYLRGMFNRDSKLNIRDEISEIISNVIEQYGYDAFIDGTIFINSDFNVGWADMNTKRLITRDGNTAQKTVICAVDVSDAMETKEGISFEMMLSDKTDYNDMPKEVRDYYFGGLSNGICEIFEEKSEQFRNLPAM